MEPQIALARRFLPLCQLPLVFVALNAGMPVQTQTQTQQLHFFINSRQGKASATLVLDTRGPLASQCDVLSTMCTHHTAPHDNHIVHGDFRPASGAGSQTVGSSFHPHFAVVRLYRVIRRAARSLRIGFLTLDVAGHLWLAAVRRGFSPAPLLRGSDRRGLGAATAL